jgi:hypothetical protein
VPYKSQKQEAFFNANREKLEKRGVNVDEWNEASKGLKLPARSKKKSTAVTQSEKPAPQYREADFRARSKNGY